MNLFRSKKTEAKAPAAKVVEPAIPDFLRKQFMSAVYGTAFRTNEFKAVSSGIESAVLRKAVSLGRPDSWAIMEIVQWPATVHPSGKDVRSTKILKRELGFFDALHDLAFFETSQKELYPQMTIPGGIEADVPHFITFGTREGIAFDVQGLPHATTVPDGHIVTGGDFDHAAEVAAQESARRKWQEISQKHGLEALRTPDLAGSFTMDAIHPKDIVLTVSQQAQVSTIAHSAMTMKVFFDMSVASEFDKAPFSWTAMKEKIGGAYGWSWKPEYLEQHTKYQDFMASLMSGMITKIEKADFLGAEVKESAIDIAKRVNASYLAMIVRSKFIVLKEAKYVHSDSIKSEFENAVENLQTRTGLPQHVVKGLAQAAIAGTQKFVTPEFVGSYADFWDRAFQEGRTRLAEQIAKAEKSGPQQPSPA